MKASCNKHGRINVTINKAEICYYCRKHLQCPLLAAITSEKVTLMREYIEIENCKMFECRESSSVTNAVNN